MHHTFVPSGLVLLAASGVELGEFVGTPKVTKYLGERFNDGIYTMHFYFFTRVSFIRTWVEFNRLKNFQASRCFRIGVVILQSMAELRDIFLKFWVVDIIFTSWWGRVVDIIFTSWWGRVVDILLRKRAAQNLIDCNLYHSVQATRREKKEPDFIEIKFWGWDSKNFGGTICGPTLLGGPSLN